MDIMSMTGFGRGEFSQDALKITVELGTVNRKQFDCNVSLPRELASLDNKLQSLIHTRISRGYVKGSVTVTQAEGAAPAVNMTAIRAQLELLRTMAKELGLPDDLSATSLLRMPESLRPNLLPDNPADLWPLLEKAALAALEKLSAMRCTEGKNLVADLQARLQALRTISLRITERAPRVPLNYRDALQKRLAELLDPGVPVDPAILAREVAVFADRCDISEELTRLTSHFTQAEKVFAEGGACGRTLDFLCQEMFREINTTGSKANDADIARDVIAFKAGLEAVREQVQNIE